MEEFVPFGSREFFMMVGVLTFARGMDFLSTWVATPNLVLEGNPIAKKLGWKWGTVMNMAVICLLGMWPLSAIVVSTASILVAARNFQSAWLMRTLGEESYRDWYVQRIQETRMSLYVYCVAANSLLVVIIGAAVVGFSGGRLVLVGIGMGIVAYGGAVAFYTLLAVWRMRRASLREERILREAATKPISHRNIVIETCGCGTSHPPDATN
jgi:hypothetical protein